MVEERTVQLQLHKTGLQAEHIEKQLELLCTQLCLCLNSPH